MSFFIVNLTQKTQMEWTGKNWPHISVLGDFAAANDTLELVELRTESHEYHGVEYIKQAPYTYGTERVTPGKDGYVLSKQRAKDWIAEQKKNESERVVVPLPRCKQCLEVFEEVDGDVQSIRDHGLCLECFAKGFRKDVVLPRPKKSS